MLYRNAEASPSPIQTILSVPDLHQVHRANVTQATARMSSSARVTD